ncbi:MAG: hypothetical protein WAV27_17600 [Xanthobacteraceae bacterium]|jgi:hypothetical protein
MTLYVEFNGEVRTVEDWARLFDCTDEQLHTRLRRNPDGGMRIVTPSQKELPDPRRRAAAGASKP